MSDISRIGVAVHAPHLHAEDQPLYRGIRADSEQHPGFACVLAPLAAEIRGRFGEDSGHECPC